MSKLSIIIQREFLTRLQKKSFILLTICMPFLFAAIIFVPVWLASIKDESSTQVAVIDETQKYLPLFFDTETYDFHTVPNLQPEYKTEDSPFEVVVHIQNDLIVDSTALKIYSRREVPIELKSYIESELSNFVRSEKLAAHGIDGLEAIIASSETHISADTVKWNEDGSETTSSAEFALVVGFVFTLLIYMFVMSYGGMVMQGVMEEKTNRIMEIMVSSVKPFELMMGKIIGIALVGFVQIAIWGIMLVLLITAAGYLFGGDVQSEAMMSSAAMTMNTSAMPAPPENEVLAVLQALPLIELTVMFILYFVGGYLLYASFFAAVGASINSQEDSSQFITPVVLIMVFGLYAAMGSAENTDGPLAFYASLFPLTSPIVMMVRIPFGVPLWEEVLSLVLLYATALFVVWISGRIYRIGILMYGKKPTVKELIKWIRL
jgi:ABC-2 type transport system permease protein